MAAALLVRYRAAGMDLPDELLRFYGAHRALVRAKVACLELAGSPPNGVARHGGGDRLPRPRQRRGPHCAASPRGHDRSQWDRQVDGGTAPCTGAGSNLFASDVVRKELAGIEGPAPAAWGEGVYRPEWTESTYVRLLALAEATLAARQPVVLDAAFLATEQRVDAAAVAARAGARLILVETICDEATVAARLAARAVRGDSPSDATLSIFRQQLASVKAVSPQVPDGALAIQVDTTAGIVGVLDAVFAGLAEAKIVVPVVSTAPQELLSVQERACDRPSGRRTENHRFG